MVQRVVLRDVCEINSRLITIVTPEAARTFMGVEREVRCVTKTRYVLEDERGINCPTTFIQHFRLVVCKANSFFLFYCRTPSASGSSTSSTPEGSHRPKNADKPKSTPTSPSVSL